ncbi:MAG: hypothetical protein JEY91_05780, partial [Spirochaetaceae bacterium]|nr:hypothetical protein [Spirochaetaceae bacterium]
MKNCIKCYFFFLFFTVITSQYLFTQNNSEIDFDEKYQYPFSLGICYQTYFPIARDVFTSGGTYQYHDISLAARIPLSSLPVLQPMAQMGLILVKAQLPDDEKRNHTQFYGNLGAYYAHRFSKQLEVGGDLGLGLSYGYFPFLDPGGEPRSALLFNAQAGVSLGLNLSYNLVLDINPRLKYFKSIDDYSYFGDLNTLLNGFAFAIGVTASYRFGEDPDSPKAEIKCIKFENIKIDPLFASMQSYYVNNPIGIVTISNCENYPVDDVSITFMQSGYMDNPTVSAEIPRIGSGETNEIDLYATFNDQVFLTE